MSIAIVTDSTSDIPVDLLGEWNIYQIPVDLTLDGQTFLDGFDLSRNDFYQKLPQLENLPTTAAPSSGRFQQLYDQIFSAGFGEIISIHASSVLSGIFNAARLAAQEFQGRIQVVDSQQLSLGPGFQVIQAAKMAARDLPVEKILEGIQSVRDRVTVYALLDTFRYIHRSGRVSWAKARLGSLLDIKPLVELKDGSVISQGLARARSRGIRQLGAVLEGLGKLEYLAVLHTNALQDGMDFIQKYAPAEIKDPLLVNVTTIIGTHVGPNGIGFAAVVK